MNIGIIGAGHIGSALATLLVGAGHTVVIANSRSPETLGDLISKLGPGARAGTPQEAAEFGELVVETIPFGKVPDLHGLPLAGKIVIDTANYYPQRDGQIDLGGETQSAWVARQLAGTRLVKAFNSIHAADLASLGDTGKPHDERRAIPVASDDAAARAEVLRLVESLGFAAVDAGTLADSVPFQAHGPLYGKPLTGAEAKAALKTA